MKCANCGKEINETDAFCPHCGERLTGFGASGPDPSRDREDADMTFIGSYDDGDSPDVHDDDRTYIDSFSNRGDRMDPDELTRMDSGGSDGFFDRRDEKMSYADSFAFSGGKESQSLDKQTGSYSNPNGYGNTGRTDAVYPGIYDNGQRRGGETGGSSSYPDGRGYDPSHGRGYHPGYVSPPPAYSQTASSSQDERTGSKMVIVVVILLILIAAAAAAFFFLRDRVPEMDSMTYDELVTDYGLSNDDSDAVRSAYYDSVRIEFEEISEGKSGYKATAVIFAPDMEEIYEKSTEESSIVDRLRRVSDDDLHKSRKSVRIEEDSEELTQNSAELLQDEINAKYMTVDEYNAEKESIGGTSTDSSGGSTAGSGNSPAGSDSKSTGDSPGSTTEPKTTTSTNSGYVIPDSSSRYISASELTGLSAWECRIARNEIYARHGRRFRDSSLQSYFNNCSWYSGTIAPDSFNESVLNAYEKANVQTIKKYEQAHGYL